MRIYAQKPILRDLCIDQRIPVLTLDGGIVGPQEPFVLSDWDKVEQHQPRNAFYQCLRRQHGLRAVARGVDERTTHGALLHSGNSKLAIRPEDVTVGEVLKQAGYYTGLIGKWGLGLEKSTGVPGKKGFDEWFGYLDQHHAHNYYPEFLWRGEARENEVRVLLEKIRTVKKANVPTVRSPTFLW